MGLREKKKAKTRQSILGSAHALLRNKDYNDITMDEIADHSDISVGTVYNYFDSKGDLLLSLILESDDQYMKEARFLIRDDSQPADIRLTDLMVLASKYCVRQLGKSAWRHVSAAALANTNSTMGRSYAVTTVKHQNLVIELMQKLQKSSLIDPEINAESAAKSLFSMKSKMFLDFVSDEAMDLEAHRNQVLQGVRYFLHGLIRRADLPVS